MSATPTDLCTPNIPCAACGSTWLSSVPLGTEFDWSVHTPGCPDFKPFAVWAKGESGFLPVSEQEKEGIPTMNLPAESDARKDIPLARGLLDYFPAALAAVAKVSKAGNEKHNPGEPMHHARGKSSDHADCIMRHLVDRGSLDPEDGLRHSAKVAWRALAMLQEELEEAGEALKPRGAK